MNCTVHPATAHQSTVGRIDDRIDGFLGDVAEFYNDPSIEKTSWEVHFFTCKNYGKAYLSPRLARNCHSDVFRMTQDKLRRRMSMCLANEFEMLHPNGASFSKAGINSWSE